MAYIFKRPKSPFWQVGYLEGGKARQRSLKVTSKAAAKLLLSEYQLREAKHLHRSTSLIIHKNIAEAFDEYIEYRAQGHRTKAWYKNAKRWFLAFCEREEIRFLVEVRHDTIERFYAERKLKRPGAARSNFRALKAVFGYAITKGYLHDNPAKNIRVDKPIGKLFRDLSFDEIDRLLFTAKIHGNAFYPFFATAYYAGLREGELIYLEHRDIDFDAGLVRVRSKPENLIKDHQERVIPLNAKLREILMEVKPQGRWLFGTKVGKPRKNNLNRELKRIGGVADINTEGLCVQTLRETFGSHLLKKGVSIYLISKYLGHSSVDVTTRHYAHIRIEETHAEINLL